MIVLYPAERKWLLMCNDKHEFSMLGIVFVEKETDRVEDRK